MPRKNKKSRRIRWANSINKPLETSEFINMSNNAVYARKSVPPSKTRHIEENSENNVNMNMRNTRSNRANRAKPVSRKRRRPSNWNNGSNANNENNESMTNSISNNNNNNYYDPEENAEIARKMEALKRNINRNRRR